MCPLAPPKATLAAQPVKPLSGRRIVITRAREQAVAFSEAVEKLGGEPFPFPTIDILPPDSYEPLDEAIDRIQEYDWIIFTSVNGVKAFLDRMRTLRKDLQSLQRASIAAIGPETAKALRSADLRVDLLPGEYRAEAILKELDPRQIAGKRVLIPRAAVARNVLPETLQEWGATVDVVAAYRTVAVGSRADRLRALLREKRVDAVTFTSPSTAAAFAGLFEGEPLAELLADTAVACIGPITRGRVEALGIRVDIVPQDYTIAGLTRAIAAYFDLKG
jgi:uroporphyrinogen III methyltransferase/synthase